MGEVGHGRREVGPQVGEDNRQVVRICPQAHEVDQGAQQQAPQKGVEAERKEAPAHRAPMLDPASDADRPEHLPGANKSNDSQLEHRWEEEGISS